MYKHALVPLDGSEVAEQVLPHIEALAEKFGSAITLLRATMPPVEPVAPAPMGFPVTPYVTQDFTDAYEAERRAAADYLDAVAKRLSSGVFQAERILVEGPAADAIIERAATLGVDLIAMTTHGRSGLQRLVLGSVADEVVRRATCPVLLVRAVEAKPGA